MTARFLSQEIFGPIKLFSPATCYRSAYTKPEEWTVMYMYVRLSILSLHLWFWNCFVDVFLVFQFITVTVVKDNLYFIFSVLFLISLKCFTRRAGTVYSSGASVFTLPSVFSIVCLFFYLCLVITPLISSNFSCSFVNYIPSSVRLTPCYIVHVQ